MSVFRMASNLSKHATGQSGAAEGLCNIQLNSTLTGTRKLTVPLHLLRAGRFNCCSTCLDALRVQW